MSLQAVHILLVEDDEIDAEAVVRALQQRKLTNPLTRVSDGETALHLLRSDAGYAPFPRPYVILLDLYLRGISGLELLTLIRQEPALKQSVVFVLTGSSREADRVTAEQAQVAGYLLKSAFAHEPSALNSLFAYYALVLERPSR